MNPGRETTPERPATGRGGGDFVLEVAVGVVGLALLAGAIAANQCWLDAHFLPSFFLPRRTQVLIETVIRLLAAAGGGWLAFAARLRVARYLARRGPATLRVLVAILLALAVSELTLRWMHLRPADWQLAEAEPRRVADPRLGWRFASGRTGRGKVGGRVVEYAFDRSGYRVPLAGDIVDPQSPAILFIGESVMFGYGLAGTESIPAQTGALMHVQAANLAVNGFGSDQAFLLLQSELPRFRRPVAVVSLFMTTLFARNLRDDRPHLGPGLAWMPAHAHGPLRWIANLLVPYHGAAAIDQGVSVTRAVLRATVDLSSARGAQALILVPHFGPEAPAEEALRRRVLDGARLPYVLVELDPDWTLPLDSHPDARAARAIAEAVVASLSARPASE